MPSLRPQYPRGVRPASRSSLSDLFETLSSCTRVAVISGAGISTSSGLSDYRSPGKRHPPRPPINHSQYISSSLTRQYYWARSFIGYPLLCSARPSLSHRSLASLHTHWPYLSGHVTQNVDGLLQQAGMCSESLVELHGSIHGLVCRSCGAHESRDLFQLRLAAANAQWKEGLGDFELRADGDAELEKDVVKKFQVPGCATCGEKQLMPTVVFHGGKVEDEVAKRAEGMVQDADGVLVVGSTVSLWSAWRLVKKVKERNGRIMCVNFGDTRGDGLWDVKVEGEVGEALKRLAGMMGIEVEEESGDREERGTALQL